MRGIRTQHVVHRGPARQRRVHRVPSVVPPDVPQQQRHRALTVRLRYARPRRPLRYAMRRVDVVARLLDGDLSEGASGRWERRVARQRAAVRAATTRPLLLLLPRARRARRRGVGVGVRVARGGRLDVVVVGGGGEARRSTGRRAAVGASSPSSRLLEPMRGGGEERRRRTRRGGEP